MTPTTILDARTTFTDGQRKRRIKRSDILDAARRFGFLVALQMERDARAGYVFWDSCSMIEQAFSKLCAEPVPSFREWALERIRRV